jgi:YidC/Oxa1 family membrane protein insertase
VGRISKKLKKQAMAYNKAGWRSMAGCVPGLLQMPSFYALFQFFLQQGLRQEGFLWAISWSSYDLFTSTIPYSVLQNRGLNDFGIVQFLYMKQLVTIQMAQPQQGMPDIWQNE